MVLGVPSYGYISRSPVNLLHGRETQLYPRAQREIRRRPPIAPIDFPVASLSIPLPDVPDIGSDISDDLSGAASDVLHTDSSGKSGGGNVLMVRNDDGGTEDGQVQFRSLIKQRALQYIPGIPAFGPNSTSSDPATSAALTRIAYAGNQITNVYTALGGFQRRWDSCSSTPYLTSSAAKQVISYDDPQSLEMKAVFVREAGMLGVNMFDVHGDTDQWDLTDAIRRGLGL